ncbi:cyclic lactone autoinducer peptide [Anaerobacterium chartisolvens]|uniref:Cyclic lactone autoinducer peptide n=1 Tax=Anaerobacterium chartisolvens TaxID=1297424 RepID=A0A369AM36_9FIRM|nr:cyclic lactone autoinducer peptide [Anaerobacterium chartisolvens]RCX10449.1 cyclic lactone autoinducer peptide [Anaerobacterium chartisolvens]
MKVVKSVLPFVSLFLILISAVTVSTASGWIFYQPKEPKQLKKQARAS